VLVCHQTVSVSGQGLENRRFARWLVVFAHEYRFLMLTLLFSWMFLAAISLLVGVTAIPNRGTETIDPFDRLVVSIWMGLLLIALILLSAACFFRLQPAGVLTGLLLAGIALVTQSWIRDRALSLLLSLRREYWPTSGRLAKALLFTVPTLLIAGYCSQQVTYFDTGLYHYQMVALLREYGVLRGAAHIHDRFGFSSSWFALATGFRAQTINGLVVLLSSVHLLVLLRRIYLACIGQKFNLQTFIGRSGSAYTAGQADCYAAIGYLIVIPYLLLGNGLANSLSPDVPVSLLLIVITWWLQLTANSSSQRRTTLLLGLAVFSIKLSTLPMSGMCALNYLAADPRRLRTWIQTFGLIVLTAGPMVATNLISSGCPLYPSGLGCLEKLPWAQSSAQAERSRTLQSNYSRTEGRSAIIGDGAGWILDWVIDDHTGSLSNVSFLTITAVVSALILVIGRQKLLAASSRSATLAISLVGLAYVLSLAPALRFGIGYLAMLPALLISSNWRRGAILVPFISGAVIVLTPYTELEYRRPRLVILLALLAIYTVILLKSRFQTPEASFMLLLASLISPLLSLTPSNVEPIVPTRIVRPLDSELERVEASGFHYYLTRYGPLKNQCWAAPVPCTHQPPDVRLQAIDPRVGLSGGVMPERRLER